MRAKSGQEEVEKWSGGHFWASGAALRATLGALWPPEGPQEGKEGANGGYGATSGGPFLDKIRKKTMKNRVSGQSSVLEWFRDHFRRVKCEEYIGPAMVCKLRPFLILEHFLAPKLGQERLHLGTPFWPPNLEITQTGARKRVPKQGPI